jgi:hypothetical protein
MNRRAQLICAWTGPVLTVLMTTIRNISRGAVHEPANTGDSRVVLLDLFPIANGLSIQYVYAVRTT